MYTIPFRKCLPVLAAITLSQSAMAQSTAFFYPDMQSGYSIDAMPGVPVYVAGGTVYDPSGDNRIHLVFYDQWGMQLNSFYLDEANVDDRCIKVMPLAANKVVVLAYAEKIGNPVGEVHLLTVSDNGSILSEVKISSQDADFPSLMPLDATLDIPSSVVAICGTASLASNPAPGDSKKAFVLTSDLNTALAMRFYDTPNGAAGNNDYDIASRIVRATGGASYYVTGSENVIAAGNFRSGAKNMLINATSLNITWSNPFFVSNSALNDEVDYGADMLETGGNYKLLINRKFNQTTTTWGIIRVNPANGMPVVAATPLEQYSNSDCIGHQLLQGDGGRIFVAGVRSNLDMNNCKRKPSLANDASPFTTHIDMTSIPGTVVNNINYLTTTGTKNASVNYWTLGGFYAPQNGYPLPLYLNDAVAFYQYAPGNVSFGLIAPLMDPTLTYLNSKFIWGDHVAKTECPTKHCNEELILLTTIPASSTPSSTIQVTNAAPSQTTIAGYPYDTYKDCFSGVYRPGTTSVAQLAAESKSLSVVPNPVQDRFVLHMNGYGNDKITVLLTDLNGRSLGGLYIGKANPELALNVPGALPAGLYLLRVTAAGHADKVMKITLGR